jgi:four helix bundle protein
MPHRYAKSHRDLLVWQKAITTAEKVYKTADQLPKHELYALGNQLRRSAISIPSNISEGKGRQTKKEFHHFLSIALGSASELETQLILIEKIYNIKTSTIAAEVLTIRKMLSVFMSHLRKS